MTQPFWLDWEYDRNNADTGTESRYGNYLASRADLFRDIWYDDPTSEFAAIAWRIANGPVMAPPLVRSHPRIDNATVERSDWDGELVANVTLVAPTPEQLVDVRTPTGQFYHGRALDSWRGSYDGVTGEDLTRRSYLLTNVEVVWRIPPGWLPTMSEAGRQAIASDKLPPAPVLLPIASDYVTRLVDLLNQEIAPLIAAMEHG